MDIRIITKSRRSSFLLCSLACSELAVVFIDPGRPGAKQIFQPRNVALLVGKLAAQADDLGLERTVLPHEVKFDAGRLRGAHAVRLAQHMGALGVGYSALEAWL
jgi:hypothetical protein